MKYEYNEMKYLRICINIWTLCSISEFVIWHTKELFIMFVTVCRYISNIFTIIIFVYAILSFLFYQRNINN